MVQFTAAIDFHPEAIKRGLHLEPGGAVQKAIDKGVMDFSQDFIPAGSASMPLAKSCYRATVPGSGVVEWPGPYAHYMYMGEVYGPNIPIFDDDSGVPTRFFSPPGQKKHPTGRDLRYKHDVNALAGSHWIDHMKAARMPKLLDRAEAAMRGRDNG